MAIRVPPRPWPRWREHARMLDNELKKLASMIDGPEITLADVERHVMRTAEVKPWELQCGGRPRPYPFA
ncbi:MAG: hypothetical protein ACLTSX_14560 [Collinsella sp.]